MSKEEKTSHDHKKPAQKQSTYLRHRSSEVTATQTQPVPVIQTARLNPCIMGPRDVMQLQQTIVGYAKAQTDTWVAGEWDQKDLILHNIKIGQSILGGARTGTATVKIKADSRYNPYLNKTIIKFFHMYPPTNFKLITSKKK